MRRLCLLLCISAVATVLSASASAATDVKEALTALKKFQSGCKAGVSYEQYNTALETPNREVKNYFAGGDDKNNPLLSAYILTALGDYAMAGRLWDDKLKGGNRTPYISEGDPTWKAFLASYPNGRSLLDRSMNPARADFSKMLSYVWGEAAKKISQAASLMPDAKQQAPPGKPKKK